MKLIVDFFLITGILIATALLFLTLKSKHKSFTKKLLAIIYSISIGYFFIFYAELHELDLLEFLCYVILSGAPLLLGPLLFFYVKSIFTTKNRIEKKEYFHFAPYIIFLLFFSFPNITNIILDKPVFSYIEFLDNNRIDYWTETILFIFYIIISLLLFNKYKKVLKANYSLLDLKNLDWSRRFFIGLLCVMFIDVTTSIYESFVNVEWETGFLTMITYIVALLYLGYYGLSKANILIPEFLLNNNNQKPIAITEEANCQKPKTTTIDISECEELKLHLKNVMQIQKPYLDENITLNSLAQLMEISDKKLSELLNQHLDTNFYDWINKYRIDVVKQKLIASEHNSSTIIEIAYDSGFKSKSSFNRIFKKETGHSPTEFKKQYIET